MNNKRASSWPARKEKLRDNPEKQKERTEYQRAWKATRKADLAKKAAEYRKKNSERVRANGRARYAANKDKIRSQNKKYLYGLTTDEATALAASQGNKCAICLCDFSTLKSTHIHIDHDHETGKVRGVLCHACNVGLGRFRDDPIRLRQAALYIEASIPWEDAPKKAAA